MAVLKYAWKNVYFICVCGAREREEAHFKVPFRHFVEGIRKPQKLSAVPMLNFFTGLQYYKVVFVYIFVPKIIS